MKSMKLISLVVIFSIWICSGYAQTQVKEFNLVKGVSSEQILNSGEKHRYTVKLDSARVALEEFTGEFFSPELSTTYSFIVEKGKLIARHFRMGDIVLSRAKPDSFNGDKWYFKHRVYKGSGPQNFRLQAYRFKGEEFEV